MVLIFTISHFILPTHTNFNFVTCNLTAYHLFRFCLVSPLILYGLNINKNRRQQFRESDQFKNRHYT